MSDCSRIEIYNDPIYDFDQLQSNHDYTHFFEENVGRANQGKNQFQTVKHLVKIEEKVNACFTKIEWLQGKVGCLEANLSLTINNAIENLAIRLTKQFSNLNASVNKIEQRQDDYLQTIRQQSKIKMEQEFGRFDESEAQKDYEHSQIDFDMTNKTTIEEQDNILNTYANTQYVFEQFKDILQNMEIEAKKCELIYQYPSMKDSNFHTQIDNLSNILFIAQLENNEVIGAFTHIGFNPKPKLIPTSNPKSFLCNLTQNRYLYAYLTNKTHSYDKNYFILGNEEIKLKSGSSTLEGNWGTNGNIFAKSEFGQNHLVKQSREWFYGPNTGQTKLIELKWYNFYVFK